jgi:uncharacterized membrane protein YgcG
MRIVRLFGAVLAAVLTAGLLLAAPAGAQPPSRLTDHVTDSSGVLTDSDRVAVNSAIDRLHRDRHIQLWVVYVDNFSRFKPENWTNQTRGASGMGSQDALLAVATNTKLYKFDVPPKMLTAAEQSSLQSAQIDPAVSVKNWTAAGIAAADGLYKSAHAPSSSKRLLLIVIAVIAVVVILAVVIVLYRRRRRRHAARQIDPSTGNGPALDQALSTADTRLSQISDYVAKYHASIGSKAQDRFQQAKQHVAAAHGNQASNANQAIAYANRASVLAAEAQTLANADVRAAVGKR